MHNKTAKMSALALIVQKPTIHRHVSVANTVNPCNYWV